MIYKYQLKRLEWFHLECLRHILKVKSTTSTHDTEIIEKTKMESVETVVTRHSLRWSGHLVRMDYSKIPKQLFYGGTAER